MHAHTAFSFFPTEVFPSQESISLGVSCRLCWAFTYYYHHSYSDCTFVLTYHDRIFFHTSERENEEISFLQSMKIFIVFHIWFIPVPDYVKALIKSLAVFLDTSRNINWVDELHSHLLLLQQLLKLNHPPRKGQTQTHNTSVCSLSCYRCLLREKRIWS